MERVKAILSGAAGIIIFICLNIPHVALAITLFRSVRLWAFLVILLVPGFGDILGIIALFQIKCYWPFIWYAVSAAIWGIITVIAAILDKQKVK